ncbi:hypothetical protein AB205_0195560 [Aquarana catesbeiana]|uniref:Uncharacterized protein n=1 Tax=Aquarana catesbeiana TaxID=8400 RepID=A0A2G9SHN3_AQUCT|nr:hypothetical protein AB205_0195560 [Aquarana catesbeiana]
MYTCRPTGPYRLCSSSPGSDEEVFLETRQPFLNTCLNMGTPQF